MGNHDVNPSWAAVDAYAMQHLHPSKATPSPSTLASALTNSTRHSLPEIAVSPAQGKFLMLQARMLGATNILEVGTLGGYSTIWLASANSRVRIVSVEIDAKHAEVGRENLRNAGVGDRVEVLVGAGLNVLPRLREEVRKGERKPFDMVFIDADKVNSAAYFDLGVEVSRAGACIVVDNVGQTGTLSERGGCKVG